MSKTIIDALFLYFDACPLLTGGRLNIDYLPENTHQAGVEYSIAASPADEIVTSYRGGGCRCRYPFVLSSVNDYGPDTAQNLLNTGFFDRLAEWLRKENRLRRLPELPPGLVSRSIRAIGAGYLYQPDINAGKYQIQCELEFYRKGA